jgi:hypothetical protein
MTAAIEKILEQWRTLTDAEREELRLLLQEGRDSIGPRSGSIVSQIKGKYSFVPASSEAFAVSKQHELELEQNRQP